MKPSATLVLDVGKTMSKLTLLGEAGDVIEKRVRPNERPVWNNRRVLDRDAIAEWLLAQLDSLAGLADIERIIPVAHGAGIVAIEDSELVHPPLDYESDMHPEVLSAYRYERDPFDVTGSPFLNGYLNAGAQIYAMEFEEPSIYANAVFLPWAQYWAYFFSGVARSEVTSLGCHSDLWDLNKNDFSPLAERMAWNKKFAPFAHAGEAIGTLKPELARLTGVSQNAKIYCGIHDSNAALNATSAFEQLRGENVAVVSTGTWFIAMNISSPDLSNLALGAENDCLINVNADRQPVPSARFMGGREIATAINSDGIEIDANSDQDALISSLSQVIRDEVFVLPAFVKNQGPFANHSSGWINKPQDANARRAAICLYAALVTNQMLELIGANGKVLIEGRFSNASVFTRAIASLRPQSDILIPVAQKEASFGAFLLVADNDLVRSSAGRLRKVKPLDMDISAYALRWNVLVNSAAEVRQ